MIEKGLTKRVFQCLIFIFLVVISACEAVCVGECVHCDEDYNFTCDLCGYKYKLVGYGICGEDVVCEIYDDGSMYLYGEISAYDTVPDYIDYVYDENYSSAGLSYYNNTVKRIVVKDGVKKISRFAFVNFIALEEIVIPESVRSISSDAFAGSSLKSVVIDRYNPYFSFEDGVLYNKDKTKLISYLSSNTCDYFLVPDTVIQIGEKAFAFNSGIINLFIPETVSSIGEDFIDTNEGFSENLVNVFFGGNVESLNLLYDFSLSGVNVYSSHSHSDINFDGLCDICMTTGDIHEHSFSYEVFEPSCLQEGYTLYQCQTCSYSYIDSIVPSVGHLLGEFVTVSEATCNSDGVKVSACQRCSYTENEVIPASQAHDYAAIDTVYSTCEQSGCVTYKCIVCEYILTEITEATGHSYSVSVIEPTCTSGGYTLYFCDYCGDEYRENDSSPLGHLMGEYIEVSSPTCTESGEMVSSCQRCDYYESFTVPSSGEHSFLQTVVEADCENMGYTNYVCEVCFFAYTDSYTEAIGHSFICNENRTNVICSDDGTHSFVCLNGCGETGTSQSGQGGKEECSFTLISEEASTCTEKGFEVYMCSVCFAVKSIVSDFAEHSYLSEVIPASCLTEGYTLHSCIECGLSYKDSETSAVGHISDNGRITVQPTYDSQGKRVFSCRICSITIKSEILPSLISVNSGADEIMNDPDSDSEEKTRLSKFKVTEIKNKSLTLNWSIIRDADIYIVSYSTDGKKWKKRSIKRNNITIRKLKSGTRYYFKVEAHKEGKLLSESKIIISATKPSKPIVKFFKIKNKKLIAEWTKIKNSDGYEVLVSSSSKFSSKKTTVYRLKKNSIVFKKLKKGSKLYLKIRAYKFVNKKKIYSDFSNIKSVKNI